MIPLKNDEEDKAETYRVYIRTSAVGLEVVLSIVVGVGLGWLAERYFPITPWGLVAGFIFGTLAAGRRLYIFVKKYLKSESQK